MKKQRMPARSSFPLPGPGQCEPSPQSGWNRPATPCQALFASSIISGQALAATFVLDIAQEAALDQQLHEAMDIGMFVETCPSRTS